MNAKLAALRAAAPKRIAIPVMTHPGIDAIGRRVIDCVTDGKVQAAAVVEVARRYPTAATTMVMDLTVEAEAFGSKVTFADDEIPTVTGRLVTDLESVQALKVPDVSTGRLPGYVEAARLAAAKVKDKAVFGGCIGPFSLAARLYGVTEIMTACFLEPDAVHLLLEKSTELLIAQAKALKAVGTDGLVVAEPAAGLLSAEMCDEFSSRYVKKMVEAVQDEDHLLVLHNCGNRGQATASMVSTGAGALHLGNQADMVEVLRETPRAVLAMGNIDPAGLMRMGTPEQVEAATLELLEKTAEFPHFILSTGCDTPPHTPEANITAFFRALDRFNAARG